MVVRHEHSLFSLPPRKRFLSSFSLVELLVAMAIIAILAAIVLAVAGPVMNIAARKRAVAEIQALSTALEGYKTDTGSFPAADLVLTNVYATTSPGGLQLTAQVLYQALSGRTNYLDAPVAGVRAYLPNFKPNQLGNAKASAGTSPGVNSTYVADPWGYPLGYSTGTTNGAAMPMYPYNGSGNFDLWSTGGTLTNTGTVFMTNTWINNWSGT